MTERAKLAQDFHNQGYNCAQAVVCAYCDLVGLDKETAYKMSEGFGFGMGCMEMCGALSGAFMLAGMKNSAGADKPARPRVRPIRSRKCSRRSSSRRTARICAATSRA